MISFCTWKSRGSNPTLIFSLSLSLSLSLLSFFMLFLLLLRDNRHCWWKSWSVITSSHGARISLSMTVRDFSVSACLPHPRIKLLSQTVHNCYMNRLLTKHTKWHVRPAKTQISLGIRAVWSESSLSTWRKLGPLASIPNSKYIHFSGYTITYNYMICNTIRNILVATHWTHSEDSDQTERMPRLTRVLAGRTVILLVLSWGGSYIDAQELHVLLQHMFLDCNCTDKHFVETKK